jgi:hypothetical protein
MTEKTCGGCYANCTFHTKDPSLILCSMSAWWAGFFGVRFNGYMDATHHACPAWTARPGADAEERCQACRHPIDHDGHCSVECANDRKWGGWLPGKDAPKDESVILALFYRIAAPRVAWYNSRSDDGIYWRDNLTGQGLASYDPLFYRPIPPTPEVEG